MTETASLIVDLHTIRCGGCKVHVEDPLIVSCTFCGATFDRVVSNHVGLAKRLMGQRADLETDEAAEEDTVEATATEELVAVPRSVLSDLASALGEIDGAGAAAAAFLSPSSTARLYSPCNARRSASLKLSFSRISSKCSRGKNRLTLP